MATETKMPPRQLIRVRRGGQLYPPRPDARPVYPTIIPPSIGKERGNPWPQFAWVAHNFLTLHAFVNPFRPQNRAIQIAQSQHEFLTLGGDPPPIKVTRLMNPHMRTFKGLKNFGGFNNFDSLYLPRIVRFTPRRTASPSSVQYLKGPKSVQSSGPIRPVFVPKGLQ